MVPFLCSIILFILLSCKGETEVLISKAQSTPSTNTTNTTNTITCPTNFIVVPGNTLLGTSNFCVMKFEAKGTSGAISTTPSAAVYVSINSYDSFTECSQYSESGFTGTFRLISTNEWMTIARNVENVISNWSGGAVGSGQIPRGHSDSTPGSVLTITDVNNSYNQTSNSALDAPGAGWEQKRTLTLSNNEVIWDFAGNAWEWTDWDASDGVMTQGPTDMTVTGLWTEPTVLSGSLLARHIQSEGGYGSAQSFGQYYPSLQAGPIRGGAWNRGTISGILAVNFDANLSTTYATTSFRCVYIP